MGQVQRHETALCHQATQQSWLRSINVTFLQQPPKAQNLVIYWYETVLAGRRIAIVLALYRTNKSHYKRQYSEGILDGQGET